jgi:hypothetical protein
LPGAAVGRKQAEGTFLRALAASELSEFGLEFLVHGDVRVAVELNEVGKQHQGAFDALDEEDVLFGSC